MKSKIFFILIMFISIELFSQSEFPKVTFLPDGTDAILFDRNQFTAVNNITDPDANPNALGKQLNGRIIDESKKIEMENLRRNGYLQSQYTCWGDLNKDGLKDFLITLVDFKDNTYYKLVLFSNKGYGKYELSIIHTFHSSCFYFITYDNVSNTIKINDCKSPGSITWNGRKFDFKYLKEEKMKTNLYSSIMSMRPKLNFYKMAL